MPGWLRQDLLVGAITAVLSAIVAGIINRRRARARLVALQVGKTVSLDASLRGDAAPHPRRWRVGRLTVNAGPPTWRPRFSVMRRPIVLPMSANVERIRQPSLREGLIVNTECHIIVAHAEGVTLELAVFPVDLPTARQAIQSGSAGGVVLPF
jgi:hypothetical protein